MECGFAGLARDKGWEVTIPGQVPADKEAELKTFLEDLNGAIPRAASGFVDDLGRFEREPLIAPTFRDELRDLRKRMLKVMREISQADE
jgi:hypothetical protein